MPATTSCVYVTSPQVAPPPSGPLSTATYPVIDSGCFGDAIDSRRLPVRLAADDAMTPARCRDLAVGAGLPYFSTQYARECFGGEAGGGGCGFCGAEGLCVGQRMRRDQRACLALSMRVYLY